MRKAIIGVQARSLALCAPRINILPHDVCDAYSLLRLGVSKGHRGLLVSDHRPIVTRELFFLKDLGCE